MFAKTFLGVEEFASKSEAKRILIESYGILNIDEDGSDLTVYEPSFAGFKFSLATLLFNPINGSPQFNGVYLQRWFSVSQVNEAKQFRDNIMNSLKNKYEDEIYVEFKNDQGFKCCEFGTYKHGSIGMIELTPQKGKDGKERLYVILTYFPFNRAAIDDEL